MKYIRISVWAFLVCFIIGLLTIDVYAVEYETTMPDDMDTTEIINEIAYRMNRTSGVDKSRPVSTNDIDLSKAFVYYLDRELLSFPTNDFAALKQYLEEKDRTLYQVPVYLDGNTWMAGVAKGFPVDEDTYDLYEKGILTEEGIARLEDRAGKWVIHFVTCYEGMIRNPYDIAARLSGDNTNTPIILGSASGVSEHNIAIFPDEQGRIGKIVSIDQLFPDEVEEWGVDNTKSDGGSSYLVVDFSHVKEVCADNPINVPFVNDEMIGENNGSSKSDTGSNEPLRTIIITAIILAAITFIFIIVKRALKLKK